MSALPQADAARARRSKLIITVVIVSIVLHLIAGVFAFFWIIARYFEKPKAQFEVVQRITIPPEKRRQQMETEQVSSLRPKPVVDNRIQSLRPTALALPDLPDVPLDQLVEIDTEVLVNDQIVTESSSRAGQGLGGDGGFLGGSGRSGSGFLEGTFYDLKQSTGRDATGMDENRYREVVSEFVRSFNPALLTNYYRASRKLYLSQIAIPVMPAEEGPEAFKVQNQVEPRLWLVHYKGKVMAPADGTYRFVGLGDDVLVVRFDGRVVFDGSWENWTDVSPVDRSRRYPAPDLPGWIDLYVGDDFSVRAGERYPIEIVIGESPGVDMLMALFIEKVGVNYPRSETGAPILPLFRMTDQSIKSSVRKRLPALDPEGELWLPAPTEASFFTIP